MLSSSSRLHFFISFYSKLFQIYMIVKKGNVDLRSSVIRKVTCINKRPGPWSNEEFCYDCQNVSVYFIKELFYFIYIYILYLFISFYRYNVINTPLLSVICTCVSEVFCCTHCVLMTQRVRKKKKTFFFQKLFSKRGLRAWLKMNSLLILICFNMKRPH